MGYVGAKPSAVPLTSADITDGIITSAKIADGTIVNADINASAAIVGSKLSGMGSYVVQAISRYNYQTAVSASSVSNYVDISGGNFVAFTPTSTNDIIYLSHFCSVRQATLNTGVDTYLMMGTSSSITSGDTKLNYDGQNLFYDASNDMYHFISKSFLLPCTSLTPSTTYYIEQAGAQHNANSVTWNYTSANGSGDYKHHNVSLIHYKPI